MMNNMQFMEQDMTGMLKAIERGIINMVITKDLSRLGRNYLETGRMINEGIQH